MKSYFSFRYSTKDIAAIVRPFDFPSNRFERGFVRSSTHMTSRGRREETVSRLSPVIEPALSAQQCNTGTAANLATQQCQYLSLNLSETGEELRNL